MVKATKTGTPREIADSFRRQIELLEAMPETLTITVTIETTVRGEAGKWEYIDYRMPREGFGPDGRSVRGRE